MRYKNTELKAQLSTLKAWLVSCDVQDIYRLAQSPSGTEADVSGRAGKSPVTYKIHADETVLELIEQIYPQSAREQEFARNRLRVGDKAVIGLVEGQPVFYGWLMFNEIEVTFGVFMPLTKRSAFGYNLHTRDSHRRLGIMSGFYGFARSYLRQRRFHTLYVGIDRDNHRSIMAHEKSGFRKTGYFHTLKLLGTCFTLARFPDAKRFSLNRLS